MIFKPKSTARTPVSAQGSTKNPSDVSEFIAKVNALGQHKTPTDAAKGRLIFALDATMSRQPTWDLACSLQAQMFETVEAVGGLDVQLVYFRGYDECRASKWVSDGRGLAKLMGGIDCRGGHTQISKVLSHIRAEQTKQAVSAVLYVGDAMEENIDALAQKAGEIGLLGCPIFMFQEGDDPLTARAFKEIARLTKGAYARFDANAPQELAELLKAVARYASGGKRALIGQTSKQAKLLLEQL